MPTNQLKEKWEEEFERGYVLSARGKVAPEKFIKSFIRELIKKIKKKEIEDTTINFKP